MVVNPDRSYCIHYIVNISRNIFKVSNPLQDCSVMWVVRLRCRDSVTERGRCWKHWPGRGGKGIWKQRGEGKLWIITPLATSPVVYLRGVTLGLIEDVDLKIATRKLYFMKIFKITFYFASLKVLWCFVKETGGQLVMGLINHCKQWWQSVEITDKMQPCNRIYYSNIYWSLNMFRAAYRSSSGALNCMCILWFTYACGDWPLSSLSGNIGDNLMTD